MFGVRILSMATAYCVILLEIYSGAIDGPTWWILPGALVIALLFAMSMYGFASDREAQASQGFVASAVQWILIIVVALVMVAFANYFGRTLLPDIYAAQAARLNG